MLNAIRIRLHRLIRGVEPRKFVNPYTQPREFKPTLRQPECVVLPPHNYAGIIKEDIKGVFFWIYSHTRDAKQVFAKGRKNAEEYRRFEELARGIR